MRQLQHLDMSDNPRLGVPGVTALAESGIVRGLRIRTWSRTRPGVPGVNADRGWRPRRAADARPLREPLGPTAVKRSRTAAACEAFAC